MNKQYSLFLIFLFITTSITTFASVEKTESSTAKLDDTLVIAFGSCAREREPQPIWANIAKHNPDVFLFIGDNQYADVYMLDGELVKQPVTNPSRFHEAYQTLSSIPEFKHFREQVPLFMGTWDDHDYGANDGGKEYPLKAESQQAFLDFFEFPKDSKLRTQEGVYHAKTIKDGDKTVQFIMLDTRYHRDYILKNPNGRPEGKGPYIPNNNTAHSMLGKQQWAWLENELKKPADLRIISSSIQVVAYEHSWEAWGTMPHERQALYRLIAKTQANGVIFLSGDRHLMEISKDTGQKGSDVPYDMWDFTSSGINEKYSPVNEHNTFRQGKVVRDTNYGVVKVKWDNTNIYDSEIVLSAHGREGKLLEEKTILLNELQIRPIN